MITPLTFCTLEDLKAIQNRLPKPIPARFSRMFLIDTKKHTYFLLDIAELSEEVAQKHNLRFNNYLFNTYSRSYTVSEIRRAYHENNIKLLDELRVNIAISQVLETIGTESIVENFSTIEDTLICCLSHDHFIFPMLTPYGHTYELSYIEEYIRKSEKDPLTSKTCSYNQLIANAPLFELISLLYENTTIEQQKKRLDSLMDKKSDLIHIYKPLPLQDILHKRKNLIRRRSILMRKLFYNNILLIILKLSLAQGFYFFTSEPFSLGLSIVTSLLTLLIFNIAVIYPLILRPEISPLNKEIYQLDSCIKTGLELEPYMDLLKMQINLLDQQIIELNKLNESRKFSSETLFFQIPHKHEEFSDLSVNTDNLDYTNNVANFNNFKQR